MGTSTAEDIIRRLPQFVDSEAIRDVAASTRWTVTDEPDGEIHHYAVVFDHGSCHAGRDRGDDPRATFEIEHGDLERLVSGDANPMILFGTGRIRVGGDLLFAARMAGFFKTPAVVPE